MKKILIIEDNVDTAELLAMLLESYGHTVQCAASGGAGLSLASIFTPDMVITDLGFPDMCGLDVIRSLAGRASSGDCTIVALTGRSDMESRRQVEQAGVRHFFVKGDELCHLLALVNQSTV